MGSDQRAPIAKLRIVGCEMMMDRGFHFVLPVMLFACLASTVTAQVPLSLQPARTNWQFDFGDKVSAEGFTAISPTDLYSDGTGYGFEAAQGLQVDTESRSLKSAKDDCITCDKPFYFSVKLPEGNYRVTLTMGSPTRAGVTTVKAELRRLMLERIQTKQGEFVETAFVVNVRTPIIQGTREVKLKDRERKQEWRAWDDRVTLEFNDQQPVIAALKIERVENLPTLFIIGDSTVCDQPSEDFSSWGQMLTRFFKPNICLANHAQSGDSYRSALSAGRFDKIFAQMKAGDFLMMQYGHNDMKVIDEVAFGDSIRLVVSKCREHGGIPIVVSSMERLRFDADGKTTNTLRGFPQMAQQTANELGAAFIDLHGMSKQFYEALGPKQGPLAFACPQGKPDATHHNNYGSYELAKCLVAGIRQTVPNLSEHLIDDLPTFDPAHPDDVIQFQSAFPASSQFAAQTPDGS